MLLSLGILLLVGFLAGEVFRKLKLPPLVGMLLTGIFLGPYVLNVLDGDLLSISADLRKIALIVILARAGLNLDLADLKKVGRPALLLCFLPATFEIVGMTIFAPMILNITTLQAMVLGTVVAAVSPAVIVPTMLKIMEEGYGTDQSIPQMLLAGASVDDVFVIVLFTSFTGLAKTGTFSAIGLLQIPTAIVLGVLGGVLLGYILAKIFKRFPMEDMAKLLLTLAGAFFLVSVEAHATGIIGFSGLLAIMAMGITMKKIHDGVALTLSRTYGKIWFIAQILLFALVGAEVDVRYAMESGLTVVLLLALVLVTRMMGVYCCTLYTKLNKKERLFSMIAYTPKATVQAAIGGIPLAMGLPGGKTILTVAVVSILLTAPLGAFAIDRMYKKCLRKGKSLLS
ncbi:MAG: cation:proton antiporter [Tissierellia bacterium]|nr:cation:proton antiporter [Tissierellia bacterium]